MKTRTLVLIGLLVFLFTTLWSAPVAVLHAWLLPRLGGQPIGLQGLSGTLGAGRVAQISFQGRPAVSDLGWQLQPLQLLLGRASLRLDGGSDGMLIDGVAYAVLSGALNLQDFRVTAPVKTAFAAAGQAFVPVEGTLAADIRHLTLRQRWPVDASGSLAARGVAWKLGREPLALGNYDVALETGTAGVKATVTTVDGALEVAGGALLSPDRRYELDLQLRPRPDAPPAVASLLRGIGQPDPQGWYHLRRKGEMAAPVAAPAPGEALPVESEVPIEDPGSQ